MGQYVASFEYEGVSDLPFTELLADPLLVLRNMPRVESIEKCAELDYKVVTTPYVFHKGLIVKGVGHVNLDVVDGKVIWTPSPHHCNESCNGMIEGEAYDHGDGRTHIKGKVSLKHPLIHRISWIFVKGLAVKVGEQFLQEFIDNFNDPVFENDIPE